MTIEEAKTEVKQGLDTLGIAPIFNDDMVTDAALAYVMWSDSSTDA